MRTPFTVKNLIIYRLTRDVDFSRLAELTPAFKFTPCGDQDIAKTGWISPMGDEYESLTHEKSGVILLCVKTEKKNIPASVIKEKLDEKVNKIEVEQARKLKRTEIASLKDAILQELLPVTLPKVTRTLVWIDIQAGLIIIDASSARRAEDINALLRKTIGSLPVVPVTMENPVELTLTKWVRSGQLPDGVNLGSEATLKAMLDEGGTVSVKNQGLVCDEIANHIETGKQVVKVGLDWQERLSFVLKDDFTINRLRFSDSLIEQNDDIDRDDYLQRFDADFHLFTGEIMELINTLITGLGGEAKQQTEAEAVAGKDKMAEGAEVV